MIEKNDKMGNRLIIEGNGNITLKLASESKDRKIGNFLKSEGNTVYFKRAHVKNIFNKTNAWGLHWELLGSLRPYDFINIKDNFGCSYWITVKDAKEHGDFLHFKGEGFEKQLFVPIEYFSNEASFKTQWKGGE
jgi:hypothetical protein